MHLLFPAVPDNCDVLQVRHHGARRFHQVSKFDLGCAAGDLRGEFHPAQVGFVHHDKSDRNVGPDLRAVRSHQVVEGAGFEMQR